VTLRVLYSFPHTLGNPGIGTTAFHQIEGLTAHGVEVEVVCTSVGRPLRGVSKVTETLSIRGRRVPHRALGVERAYAYHDMRAAAIVERRGAEFDVVHTWPAGCERTLAAARRRGLTGFREAPSAHTQTAFEDAENEAAHLGIELPRDHHHRYDAHRLSQELQEFAAADVLLVPSPYVERTFLERGFPPHRLVRHQYGFDPESFPIRKQPRARDVRPLIATFVGRGEPNKGLHYALRAWVESGAAASGRFVICGEILPAYRTRIGDLLSHPSVEERGFVRDVGEIMREADVLFLPTVTEGSALVTYEAQAAGCALIVSDAAGAPCEHRRQGLIHRARDLDSLVEHTALLNGDAALLRTLQAGALANAATLTWRAAGQRLADAYREGMVSVAMAA
jgi:glycosyltransferase involved in cell wall biosynthesis